MPTFINVVVNAAKIKYGTPLAFKAALNGKATKPGISDTEPEKQAIRKPLSPLLAPIARSIKAGGIIVMIIANRIIASRKVEDVIHILLRDIFKAE